jgi:hypothetical protein
MLDAGKYKLKSNIRIHLYVSEAPCGDSSMLYKNESESDFHWTGAKAQ